MTISNKLLIAAFFVTHMLYVSSAKAGNIFDCESVQSGVWEDAANWTNCNGLYPGQTTDGNQRRATVKSNHIITLGLESVNLIGFNMENGSELIIADQFPDMSLVTNPEPIDTTAGQITVNAANFLINAQFNDALLGAIDGSTHLEVLAESNIIFSGDMGQVTPLLSLNTPNPAAFIRFDSTRTIDLNGSDDSALNTISMESGAVVTINHSGTGNLVFNGTIDRLGNSPQRLFINKDEGEAVFNDSVDLGQLTVTGTGSARINTTEMKTVSGPTNSGEMRFDTPVTVSSNVSFVIDGNVGGLILNSDLEASSEPGSDSNVVLSIPTTAQLSAVGQSQALDSLNVTGIGTLILNGNVTTQGPQDFQVPITMDQNTTFITADLIQFSEQITGTDNQITLNMGGNGFEASQLNLLDIARITIGGSGNTTLTTDWITDSSLNVFQDFNVAGNVRMEADAVLFFGAVNLNGGNLTIGGRGATILGSVDGSGASETLIIDFINDNRVLSTGPSTVFNVPTEINTGLFLPTRSQHNADITVMNTAGFRSFAVDIDAALNLRDGAELQLLPSNFSTRTEANVLTYPSGFQNTYVSINGNTPVTGYGQIGIQDGPVILGGNLETEVFSAISKDEEYMIIENQSVNPVVNGFVGLPEGALTNDGLFTISYQGGDGNDVVLTAACSQEIVVTFQAFPGSGATTLEEDIEDACDGAVLNFGPDIGVNTIGIGDTFVLDKSLTLNGNGYALQGPNSASLFEVNNGSTLTLNNISIINTTGDGAILNQGNLVLNNVYFDSNTQTNLSPGGGGAILNLGDAQINNTTFFNNDAERGGAIFNDTLATMNVTNSTFFENGQVDAIQGGAIHNRGQLVLTNSTLVDSGGGNVAGNTIFNSGNSAILTIQNTVIEASAALIECDNNNGAVVNQLNSFVDDGSCDADLFGVAGLNDWADEGGFANTISLQENSQLIDAGDDGVCPARDVLNTIRPQRFQCDIGAVEFVDNSNPSVLAINFNGTPLPSCQSRMDELAVGFDVTYSEPMLNADDVLNYVFVFAGEDLNFDPPFDADNQIFSFDAAVSNNDPQTPTISLSINQPLTEGLYRLELAASITDEFNNPLNASEDLLYQFRIDQENLFNNGEYDDCDGVDINNSWQYTTSAVAPDSVTTGGAPGEFIPDQQDLFESEHSGALRIFTFDDNRYYQVSQCVNTSETLPLALSGSVQIQSFFPTNTDQGGDPTPDLSEVQFQCEYWDSTDCMGNSLGIESSTLNEVGSFDTTVLIEHEFNPGPSSMRSVTCGVWVRPDRLDTFTTLIDGLKLMGQDLIFSDDFEN